MMDFLLHLSGVEADLGRIIDILVNKYGRNALCRMALFEKRNRQLNGIFVVGIDFGKCNVPCCPDSR